MSQEFLPQKPPPIRSKKLLNHLKKIFKLTLHNFIVIYRFYEFSPKAPEKKYPSAKERFSSEQREQCKEAFEDSQKRMDKLEDKALALFKTSTWIIPLCGAVLGFLLKKSFFYGSGCQWTLIVFSILWALFLSSAVIATFRARTIRELQSIGIEAIIDTETEKLHEYDKERDGLGLLWCAKMNDAVSDLKADFIRAAQMFISISMIFLLIGTFFIGIQYARDPDQDKYLDAINIINSELHAIANEIRNVSTIEKNLVTRLDELIKNQEKIEKKLQAITSEKKEQK